MGVTTRMPRTIEEAQRELWRGAGDAWTMVADLLTATAVWGAVGFGLDKVFGTAPVLLVIGAVVGHATGIYMVYRRGQQMRARAERGRRRSMSEEST